VKLLAFDVLGDYGHFRKFYTTSSPLTFSVMPPTAVYGLLGAILGLSNEDNQYLNVLNARTVKLAIQVLRPVRKAMIGINHINTKTGFWALRTSANPRTQIRMEVLQEPGFRLYVHLKDETLFRKLRDMVSAHESVYTPCLGLSEMIAEIRYYGEGEAHPVENIGSVFCEVHSLIPAALLNNRSIRLEPGLQLLKEKMPINMSQEREVEQYTYFVFDRTGKPVQLSAHSIYRFDLDESRILFCNEVHN
jgi:CRISPR-associated protein Cas5h